MSRPQGKQARLALPTLFQRLNYRPHQSQLAVHLSRARHRVICAGVRSGKTTCAAVELVMAALQPGEFRVVWCCAPTYSLCEKVWREVVRYFQNYLPELILPGSRLSDMKLLVRNLGGGITEIRARSTDNPTSLLGEGVDFMVVDEASRVDAEAWQNALSQRLLDKRGRALIISSPRGYNWFHGVWLLGQPGPDRDAEYESWHWPSSVNPTLLPEDLAAEKARLPAAAYRQEILAEWVGGEGQVFSSTAVRACAKLEWASSKGVPPLAGDAYTRPERYYAGLDLAQVSDYTVLAILNSSRELVYLDRFNKLSWEQQIPRVTAALQHYKNAECYVDSTGLGSSICDRLRDAGARVKPYVLSQQSKADLLNNLVALVDHGQITLPSPKCGANARALVDELEAYSYSTTTAGNVRMSAPGSGHDDCVISLALAAWGCRLKAKARGRASTITLDAPALQAPTKASIRVGSLPSLTRPEGFFGRGGRRW